MCVCAQTTVLRRPHLNHSNRMNRLLLLFSTLVTDLVTLSPSMSLAEMLGLRMQPEIHTVMIYCVCVCVIPPLCPSEWRICSLAAPGSASRWRADGVSFQWTASSFPAVVWAFDWGRTQLGWNSWRLRERHETHSATNLWQRLLLYQSQIILNQSHFNTRGITTSVTVT